MRKLLILAASMLALAGCQTAQQVAAADDATCRGYGAKVGSDAYVQCRSMADQRHAIDGLRQNNRSAQNYHNITTSMARAANGGY